MVLKALEKTDPIVIVGAGIFGLSSAIHFAQRGYKDITIFDKHPYEQTQYSYFDGCDAASADLNKIFRSAYGSQTEYQDLSTEAVKTWHAWNSELASGYCVPQGMSKDDKLFISNGNLSLTDQLELPPFEVETIKNMEAAGHANTQLITTSSSDAATAQRKGFSFAIDPFHRRQRGQGYLGVLDTTGGTTIADRACRFALHKAKQLGVRTILDAKSGTLSSFIRDPSGIVTGIVTFDGKSHSAARTIVACGGWTPSLIPSLDSVCETTCGSIVMMKIPKSSPLFARFSPENFPSWQHNMRVGAEGGLYGFPVTDDGYLKIGYRGTKWTNPRRQADGKERSVPVTRYTEEGKITQIPAQALRVIKRFIADWLPELPEAGIDIEMTRLCWYTDSWDNHFVIDHVPEMEGVLVATGGSGHAFKYLPNIGGWIVDIVEGKGLERQLVKRWRYRKMRIGEDVVNKLMEGSAGPRVLGKTKMSTDADLTLGETARL